MRPPPPPVLTPVPTAPPATAPPTLVELMGPGASEPVPNQTPPAAAPPAARPAPDQVPGVIEVHARPAALWQRITAFIVDGSLICAVLALYLVAAAALISPRGVPGTQLTGIDGVMARVHQLHAVLAPCVALALVLGLVYTAVFALLWNGRTPGRRLLGIRLVDRTGLAPAPWRAVVRAVLAVVSFVPFLAGFWLALFDRRGQTLHDKLTQTFVIRPS